MKDFGKLTGFTQNGQDILLDFEGKTARVSVITSKIINVFYAYELENYHSKAIEGDKKQDVSITVTEKEDGLWICTEDVKVRVSDGFYVDFFDKDGNEVCADYREERKPLETISEEHRKLLAEEGHDFTDPNVEHAFDVIKKMQGS